MVGSASLTIGPRKDETPFRFPTLRFSSVPSRPSFLAYRLGGYTHMKIQATGNQQQLCVEGWKKLVVGEEEPSGKQHKHDINGRVLSRSSVVLEINILKSFQEMRLLSSGCCSFWQDGWWWVVMGVGLPFLSHYYYRLTTPLEPFALEQII